MMLIIVFFFPYVLKFFFPVLPFFFRGGGRVQEDIKERRSLTTGALRKR